MNILICSLLGIIIGLLCFMINRGYWRGDRKGEGLLDECHYRPKIKVYIAGEEFISKLWKDAEKQ